MERHVARVFKSRRDLYVQLLVPDLSETLFSVSTIKLKTKGVAGAKEIGGLFAAEFFKRKIESVRFDRGRWQYKGRLKAFVEASRGAGVPF